MKTTTNPCYAQSTSNFTITTQIEPQSEFVYVSTSIPSAIVIISTQYQELPDKQKLELLSKLQEWIDNKQTEIKETEIELKEMKPEKLYTEEQVIKAYVIGNNHGLTGVFDCSIEELSLTPIELPSDEEVNEKANSLQDEKDGDLYNEGINEGFYLGVEYMQQQILNQTK
jgi:hypothetical protein